MITITLDFENFFAIRTCFRSHFAVVFMVTELDLSRCKLTVLTNDWNVSLCFVFLFVRLSYDLSTFLTLVVDSCALHLVHSKLRCLNSALAVLA